MTFAMKLLRPLIVFLVLVLAWQGFVEVSGVAAFILPGPDKVGVALLEHWRELRHHGAITLTEIVLGLLAGSVLGVASALTISWFRPARQWLMPILVVSQAIPVFAIAPILVLWLGYGMISKIAMATLIIYFPVTAAFLDGLRRTEPGWLDLASTMGGSRLRVLRHIRIPAALPALTSGVRVATAVAPIGAVVGEWVGSSAGLGHFMLQKNARMEIDVMFAALFVLALIAVALYFAVDWALRRALPWQADDAKSD